MYSEKKFQIGSFFYSLFYYSLLFIIINIKPYLVMSNGRAVDSTKHCEKRLPLKWRSFGKELIFHEFDFKTSDLDLDVLKSSIWKHKTLCDKGIFSFIIILQLWQPIELKFSQANVILSIRWDTIVIRLVFGNIITKNAQCL